MKQEIVKVAACTPHVAIGDPVRNRNNILEVILQHVKSGTPANLFVFPELCMTGYTCADLFNMGYLAEKALDETVLLANNLGTVCSDVVIVGLPVRLDNQLFNCAAVLNGGQIVGIVPKSYIPNYNEFYEGRWFSPAEKCKSRTIQVAGKEIPFGTDLLFKDSNSRAVIGIDICEDLWVPIPPSTFACFAGANIIANLSASNETIGKQAYRRDLVRMQSAKTYSAYVYSSAGTDESSTDLVFSGHSIIAASGQILSDSIYPQIPHCEGATIDIEQLENDRVKCGTFMGQAQHKDFRVVSVNMATHRLISHDVSPLPFVPNKKDCAGRCKEVTDIQANGLATRLRNTGISKMVLGISGGLDSTLALLVAVKAANLCALPPENIICLTMPGFGTTKGTHANAVQLVKLLGCTLKEIDIRAEAELHMKCMGRPTEYQGESDVTYENIQARIRTLYLMNTANQENALVIGTGDLSELALGWCTYNGDHMSMYAVNSGVPKTLVRYLVLSYAQVKGFEHLEGVLRSICDTPISPELAPTSGAGEMLQQTEKSIGKYDIHDFCLYHYIRHGFSPEKIHKMAVQTFGGQLDADEIEKTVATFFRRFKKQQFKRSCLPDGPKVGSVSLSPRGDWRMPSDI